MPESRRHKLTFKNLIDWAGAESSMSAAQRRKPIGDVWMDSRKVRPGDVFLALASDSDDGHNYVDKAIASGATAAIVSKSKMKRFAAKMHRQLIAVNDPLKAIGRVAHAYRIMLNIPIIAITGSNGKTTTRQFIASVLKSRFVVGETSGNWNNHIGVPLTILRFKGNERIGVIELAANHAKEIGPLSKIAQPDIGVITNIGYAHIGNFQSLEQTTKTKFEIIDGFKHTSDFLLLNGDDARLVKKAKTCAYPSVLFGFSSHCAVRAEEVSVSTSGTTSFAVDGYQYELSMPGQHFVYSALAAIYLGRRFGISSADISQSLHELKPDPLRGHIEKKRGITFIVDCYNANPSSMQSALSLLASAGSTGRTVAIIGDMLELGRSSSQLHKQLGARAAASGVDCIIAVGQYARYVAAGARDKAMNSRAIHCVENAAEALAAARMVLKSGDTALLKASRAIKLESVFKGF